MHFVWLHLLIRPVNNPIDIFLINPDIMSYHVLFIKYLWICKIPLVSVVLKSTEKKIYNSIYSCFFSYH